MITPKYSVVVPVYNRPEEVKELLESLIQQSFKDFEVLIIEDGSSDRCEEAVADYKNDLQIKYFFKTNTGQGFSRNYGFEKAIGQWLVVFDSDCIIPPKYFEIVNHYLKTNRIDAFGGPDRAHESFSSIQKAISYSMTSLFTTGGIRGSKRHMGTFHPRSFNMGIRKEVYEETKGYILPKKGEDIEFSIRIIESGFKTGLIEEAFVYHKRRTNFWQFFKQLHFFGTARINVFRFYKSELKLVHFFPTLFLLGFFSGVFLAVGMPDYLGIVLGFYTLYFLIILFHSTYQTKSLKVGFLSIITTWIQLCAYGIGFLKEGFIYLRRG